MTREQIESILKTAGAKSEKEGQSFAEGSNVTFHIAHDGASLSFQKIENVRFEGELLYAKSAKQSLAFVISDVFAVAVEGAGGQPPRRPAGF
jgi:anti-sigma-K factor RskA